MIIAGREVNNIDANATSPPPLSPNRPFSNKIKMSRGVLFCFYNKVSTALVYILASLCQIYKFTFTTMHPVNIFYNVYQYRKLNILKTKNYRKHNVRPEFSFKKHVH